MGARRSGGLGGAVVGVLACVVAVGIAGVAYDRVVGDDEDVEPSEEELAAALLDEADVTGAATVPGQFVGIDFDAEVAALAAFAEAEVVAESTECHRMARRVIPGRSAPAAGAAFERSDGTVVLETLEPVDDGDLPTGDLGIWTGGVCRVLLPGADDDGGPEVIVGPGGEYDDLGDDAWGTCLDVGDPEVDMDDDYVCVVAVERDGVAITIHVIANGNLARPAELAHSLADAADAKLAASR